MLILDVIITLFYANQAQTPEPAWRLQHNGLLLLHKMFAKDQHNREHYRAFQFW